MMHDACTDMTAAAAAGGRERQVSGFESRADLDLGLVTVI